MATNCGRCFADIKRGDKVIKCCSGLCDEVYHSKCLNLSTEEYTYLTTRKNIGWFCDSCAEKKNNYLRIALEEMREALEDINENVKKQNTKVENIRSQIETSNNNLQTTIKEISEKRNLDTYAEKLKLKKHEPVVIIKPKNQEQKSADTKKELRRSIDPTDLEISGLRSVSKGGIIIECKDKESVNKLKEKAESNLGSEYEVKIPNKRLPRVKIVGLTEKWSFETLEEKMKSQNSYLDSEDVVLKVVHIRESKGKRRNYTVYTEVNAYAYRLMLKEEKLNIGWDRCRIFDAVEVTRCFSCSGFNHKASQCKYKVACPKCAGSHQLSECKATEEEEKCVNCVRAVENLKMKLDVNHAAWSADCPVLKRKLELERSKIDFLE